MGCFEFYLLPLYYYFKYFGQINWLSKFIYVFIYSWLFVIYIDLQLSRIVSKVYKTLELEFIWALFNNIKFN